MAELHTVVYRLIQSQNDTLNQQPNVTNNKSISSTQILVITDRNKLSSSPMRHKLNH
jgi:hypothetical protein